MYIHLHMRWEIVDTVIGIQFFFSSNEYPFNIQYCLFEVKNSLDSTVGIFGFMDNR